MYLIIVVVKHQTSNINNKDNIDSNVASLPSPRKLPRIVCRPNESDNDDLDDEDRKKKQRMNHCKCQQLH